MPLYEKIQASGNPYSNIFYAVLVNISNFIQENTVRKKPVF